MYCHLVLYVEFDKLHTTFDINMTMGTLLVLIMLLAVDGRLLNKTTDMSQHSGPASTMCLKNGTIVQLADLRNTYWAGTHTVDIVMSHKYKFLYVDVVKAASSTIRGLLFDVLNVAWGYNVNGSRVCPEGKWRIDAVPRRCRYKLSQLHSNVINQMGYFVFTFVREPIAKYVSGHKEAIKQSSRKHNTSNINELLDMMTQPGANKKKYPFTNEHFEPSSYRLSPLTNDRQPLHYDFVGKVENWKQDWAYVVSRFHEITSIQRKKLMEGTTTLLNVGNATHKHLTLSNASIVKFCNSDAFGNEFDLFCYPKPVQCRNSTIQ